jgi:pSer/pThr/pTyr-binding forkhead associated (FHA) protein
VSTRTETRTCGRDPGCDLVLEHPTLSRVHARLELAADGLVWVHDAGSSNGTFVNRNESWVRIRKIALCIGDQVRFGDVEVPVKDLTAVFGGHANTRLAEQRFRVKHARNTGRTSATQAEHGPGLKKPRRNPVTGKIEEERDSNV